MLIRLFASSNLLTTMNDSSFHQFDFRAGNRVWEISYVLESLNCHLFGEIWDLAGHVQQPLNCIPWVDVSHVGQKTKIHFEDNMTRFLVVAYHSSPFFFNLVHRGLFPESSLTYPSLFWNQIILLYRRLITSLQGRPKPLSWHSIIRGISCLFVSSVSCGPIRNTPANA